MLLAVEGGGFITSSASGYIKGLTVLLLGKKPEERPMRVTPWNQYQLVDQETNRDLHLATRKKLVRGCTSFLCFGRAAAGLESPSTLKVESTRHHTQDVHKSSPDLEKFKEKVCNSVLVDDDDNVNNINACSPLKVEAIHHHQCHTQAVVKSSLDLEKVKEKVCTSVLLDDDDDDCINKVNAFSLRSSLKRPAGMVSVSVAVDNECEGENIHGNDANGVDYTGRRVQWTDVSGGELFAIREFEPSEYDDSDDEFGNRNGRSCLCKLM